MTTLEYMEKQLSKHKMNYQRESEHGASEEVLANISKKIGYYSVVVELLKGRWKQWHIKGNSKREIK